MALTAVITSAEALVQQCIAGDNAAYRLLYERYNKAMFNTALRIVNNVTDAEDILQEAFIDAFRQLKSFEGRSSFGAWLKQIVIYKSIAALKKKRMDFVEMDEVPDIAEELPLNDENTWYTVDFIGQSLQHLPDGYRTVLSLYLLEGFDQKEIADLLNVAPSTVRTQYIRGKEKLLDLLKTGKYMSDNLEKFIRSNRREFDSESPSGSVWDKIEATIPAKKHAKRFSLRDIYKWSAAAAIIFVALTSVYFLVIRKNSHDGSLTNPPLATVNPDETNGMTPDHAAEFKAVYRSIGERQIQLKSVTADQPALYKQFQEDLRALDSSYQALKKQAEQSPNRDLIVEAMIQNLRLQAELLSRQLMISNQLNNNNEKKSTNETRI